MPLRIFLGDITTIQADAIAHSVNSAFEPVSSISKAIFSAAGEEKLKDACGALGTLSAGEAAITDGFALPAKYIIHTGEPEFSDEAGKTNDLLASCYLSALELGRARSLGSIALPLLCAERCGIPPEEFLELALQIIGDWLAANEMDIILVLSSKSELSLPSALERDLRAFIDGHYAAHLVMRMRDSRPFYGAADDHEPHEIHDADLGPVDFAGVSEGDEDEEDDAAEGEDQDQSLDSRDAADISSLIEVRELSCFEFKAPHRKRAQAKKNVPLDEPFSLALLKLIRDKGKTDVEVYKRANIDRKLFSKIRTGGGYMPSKRTALALSLALELSLEETNDLLRKAGYALSNSILFDVIVQYFITKQKFNIHEINAVLFEYDQPLLGA